jgi:hypothetical protein
LRLRAAGKEREVGSCLLLEIEKKGVECLVVAWQFERFELYFSLERPGEGAFL